jgi:hypothetical protein
MLQFDYRLQRTCAMHECLKGTCETEISNFRFRRSQPASETKDCLVFPYS